MANTRKPLGSVFEAALGNSKGFGAPAEGISGASFTPGGTIPVGFFSSCDSAGRDAGTEAGCCARSASAAAIIAAKSRIDSFIARFILAPRWSLLWGRRRRYDHHCRTRGNKIFLRHALDVGRGYFQIALEFGVDQIRILSNHGRRAKYHCFLFICLTAQDNSWDFLVFGLLEFSRTNRLGLQSVQYRQRRFFSF